MNEQYRIKARKHWAKWLPQKVAELKEAGQLDAALQIAANLTRAKVDELMAQGYQLHEAEEVALPEYVLLKPEAKANLAPWERAELAAQEKQFQSLMR